MIDAVPFIMMRFYEISREDHNILWYGISSPSMKS